MVELNTTLERRQTITKRVSVRSCRFSFSFDLRWNASLYLTRYAQNVFFCVSRTTTFEYNVIIWVELRLLHICTFFAIYIGLIWVLSHFFVVNLGCLLNRFTVLVWYLDIVNHWCRHKSFSTFLCFYHFSNNTRFSDLRHIISFYYLFNSLFNLWRFVRVVRVLCIEHINKKEFIQIHYNCNKWNIIKQINEIKQHYYIVKANPTLITYVNCRLWNNFSLILQ